MKKLLLGLVSLCGIACAQFTSFPQGAGSGNGIPNVSTLPATCTPTGSPNVVFLTTGTVGPYACPTPNTWVFLGGGSGSVTSVTASGGTCTASGSPITATGTVQSCQTVNAQVGTSYTVADSDRGKLITQTNGSASAYTLPQAGSGGNFASGWFASLQNLGAGTLTVTPTVSTIDGTASLSLTTGQGVAIFSDGTNYHTFRGMTGTVALTTAGTIPFTSAQSGVVAQDANNFFWNSSLAALKVGPRSGFGTVATRLYNQTLHTFTALNPSTAGLSGAQPTLFNTILADNGTSFTNSGYSAFIDTHASATRTNAVGFEGDAFLVGAGTTDYLLGNSGFAEQDGGTTLEVGSLIGGGSAMTAGTTGYLTSIIAGSPTQTGGAISLNAVGVHVHDQKGYGAGGSIGILGDDQTNSGKQFVFGAGAGEFHDLVTSIGANYKILNGGVNGSFTGGLQFGTTAAPSTYLHGIFTSHSSGADAQNEMEFCLANAAGTNCAVTPLTLRGDGHSVFTGLGDFSSGSLLLPTASSDPGTCAAGQIEYNSTGVVAKLCGPANTWTAIGSGGGLTPQADQTVLANLSGSSAVPTPNTMAALQSSIWSGVPSSGGPLPDTARTSTTQLTVGGTCSSGLPCRVKIGDTVYSIAASGVATISTGTGDIKTYVDPLTGALTVAYGGGTFASGNVTCNSGCTATFTGTTPTWPAEAYQSASWTATSSGQFDATGINYLATATTQKQIALAVGGCLALTETASKFTFDSSGCAGGSGMAIGGGISGSPVTNGLLYSDGSATLRNNANLTWNGSYITNSSSSTSSTGITLTNTSTGGHSLSLGVGGQSNHPGYYLWYDGTLSSNEIAFNATTLGAESFHIGSGAVYCISSSTDAAGGCDVSLARSGSSIMAIGDGGFNSNGYTKSGGSIYNQNPVSITQPSNTILLRGPTSVPTAYSITLPSAGSTGIFHCTFATADCAVSLSAISLTADVTGLLPHANIASTAVTPGSYTNANITVAADGSITAASNGTGGSGGTGNAGSVVTTTFSATPTFTCPSSSAGTVTDFVLSTTLTANITAANIASCTTGQILTFDFQQDATGGRTVAMPAGFDAPNISPIASAHTKLIYYYNGASTRLLAQISDSGPMILTEQSAPGTPAASAAYCWPDSTDHQGIECKANNSANVFKLTLSGADINTATGQVTATHLASALPVAQGGTGIGSFGTGVATWLGTPSSANLAAAVTGETGSGALVFGTSPTLVTPALGTPTALVLTNATGLPLSGLAAQSADTAVMNASGSSAAPTAVSIPNCQDSAGNHLNYNTTTHAYSCGTSSSGGGGGAFSSITSGTNTTATMTVGSGASIVPSGTGSITATAIPTAQTRRVCDMAIGDESGSALTNAQLGPQKRMCFVPAAATIVEVDVSADAGTPSVIVAKNAAGTVTNIVSAALATAASGGIACSNTGGTTGIDGATTCSATLQNTSLSAGNYLELVSGTAGGTAKLMTVHVTFTIN